LVAVLVEEPSQEQLVAKLENAASVAICAPILCEAEMVMIRKVGALGRRLTAEFLDTFGVDLMVFGEPHLRAAIEAYLRYGKGRHPARLNYGDCMSYAAARVAGLPLLFVGDDFVRTDIDAA
jgi:ribonuclease VapC